MKKLLEKSVTDVIVKNDPTDDKILKEYTQQFGHFYPRIKPTMVSIPLQFGQYTFNLEKYTKYHIDLVYNKKQFTYKKLNLIFNVKCKRELLNINEFTFEWQNSAYIEKKEKKTLFDPFEDENSIILKFYQNNKVTIIDHYYDVMAGRDDMHYFSIYIGKVLPKPFKIPLNKKNDIYFKFKLKINK